MSLSTVQWLIFSVLDFLLKVGCLYLVGGGISLGLASLSTLVWLAFILWMFHLLFLGVARGLLAFLTLPSRANFVLTLLIGESLFGVIAGLSLISGMSGNLIRCPPGRTSCPWNDITAGEIQSVGSIVLFLIVINLLPVLISMVLGAIANLTGRLLKRSSPAVWD